MNKMIAYGLSVCMVSACAEPGALYAQTLAPAAQVLKMPEASGKFVLPQELGRVQEQHETEKQRKIFIIEDAHGIPAAQESIAGIIVHLRKHEQIDGD